MSELMTFKGKTVLHQNKDPEKHLEFSMYFIKELSKIFSYILYQRVETNS